MTLVSSRISDSVVPNQYMLPGLLSSSELSLNGDMRGLVGASKIYLVPLKYT
jgi:hypothetical protein